MVCLRVDIIEEEKMARKRHAELMVVEIWWTIFVSFAM